MHRWKKTALALLSSKALLVGSSVWAVGFGELELDSFLNEPLDARIALLDVDDLLPTQVLVKLASEEEFERVGAERTFLLMGLSFQVVIDSEGESYVALSSKELIREPILDFILEVKWPDGRLLRDYTVLLDPPRFDDGVLVPTEGANEALLSNDAPGTGVPSLASVGVDDGKPNTAGSNYRVQPNDTLWKIAQRAQLPGASVQATMLEIQRQNPDAFINNNINLLKAGQVLYLPTEIDASLSDREVVTATIRRQNEDWREGRASPARAQLKIAADSEAEAGDALSAKRVPDTSDEPAQGAGLTVGNAKLAQLQTQLSQMEEEMAILQAIIDAKDQQLALMRATLAAGIDTDAMVSSDQVSSLRPAGMPEQRARGDIGDEIDSVNAALAAASSTISESAKPGESSDTGVPDSAESIKSRTPVADSAESIKPRTPAAELPNPIRPITTPPVVSGEVASSTIPWYQIAGGVGIAALFAALALFLHRRRALAREQAVREQIEPSDHVDALFDQLQEGQRQQQQQSAAGDVVLEPENASFEDAEFDLDEIDDVLNRDNSEADLQASSAALLDELDLSELLDSEQMVLDSDSDDQEAGTAGEAYVAPNEDAPAAKLDLARAYLDMEDFESARVVLEDVLQVGDEAQRREAQALLTTL